MPSLPSPSRRARRAAPRGRSPLRLASVLALAGALGTGGSLAAATAADAATAEAWDVVAACESGGDWSLDSGNGYFGGLQFQPATWAEFGGRDFAENAHRATREQQITVAERVLSVQGPGAWPQCSLGAGLEPGTVPATGAPPTAQDAVPTAQDAAGTRPDAAGTAGRPGTVDRPATAAEPGPAAPHPASRPAVGVPLDALTVSTAYGTPGAWAAGHHTGVDFAVPTGTPVKAVADGTVVSSGWAGAYGNAVVIQHDDGIHTLSAHLSTTGVTPGEHLTAGQQIGLSGSTGNSTGPHLHFEVRTRNTYGADIDPLAYLRSIGVTV